MALNFRPVQEKWGEASSCFVDNMAGLLQLIADFGGCGRVEQTTYGDNITVWIEAGTRFLDTIEAYRFRSIVVRELRGEGVSAVRSVCSSMRSLAARWRSSLNDDGSLTFYIDAF